MTTCTVANSRLDFKRVVEDGYWLFVNLPLPAPFRGDHDLNRQSHYHQDILRLPSTATRQPSLQIILDEAKFFKSRTIGPIAGNLEGLQPVVDPGSAKPQPALPFPRGTYRLLPKGYRGECGPLLVIF